MGDASPGGSMAAQILSASGGSVALLALLRFCLRSTNCSLKSTVDIPGGEIKVTMGEPDSSNEGSATTDDDLSAAQKQSVVTVAIGRC